MSRLLRRRVLLAKAPATRSIGARRRAMRLRRRAKRLMLRAARRMTAVRSGESHILSMYDRASPRLPRVSLHQSFGDLTSIVAAGAAPGPYECRSPFSRTVRRPLSSRPRAEWTIRRAIIVGSLALPGLIVRP